MSKKFVVIDTELHLAPLEEVKDAVLKCAPTDGINPHVWVVEPMMPFVKVFDVNEHVRIMDEAGVDMALAGLPPFNPLGIEVCKRFNDGLVRVTKEYPGRFIPLAHVPITEGQSAINELDRAVTELGFKGVGVLTSERGCRLDDPQFKPFFKKVSQLGIPVMVHPNVTMPVWGGDKNNMSQGSSREYEIIKTFNEVLYGVLPEFPDINFLFAHYGGGIPFLVGNLMSRYAPNDPSWLMPQKMRSKTIQEFTEYGMKQGFDKLIDRVYINTAGSGGWIPAVKQALLGWRTDRLCFGSDHPFEFQGRGEDFKAFVSNIEGLDIPDEEKANVLGGNAKRLFKV